MPERPAGTGFAARRAALAGRAAARTQLLSPAALLHRLDHSLQLLSDGPVDLPERQRTLRNTLAWSYDLLDAADATLFRRLPVFAGGWTIEAAAAVSRC